MTIPSEYFSNALPLPKEDIILLFETVAQVTQLFVAPFGLSEESDLILGEEVASADYKSIYRSWEDSLSRRLYSLRQMPEDRIAASMQLFIEKEHDSEVLQALRKNESLATQTLRPSTVVELPLEASPDLAVAALQSVISALQSANVDFHESLRSIKSQNPHILNSLYSSDVNFIATSFSQETLEKVLNCLTSLEVPCSGSKIRLSYDQYIALLDAYQQEECVQTILRSLLSPSQIQLLSTQTQITALKFVRCIGTENFLLNGVFCHPIVSSILQLGLQLNQECSESFQKDEDLYFTTMKLLTAVDKIQELKKSSQSSNIFGFPQEDPENETGDTLQIMCLVDEIFGKEDLESDAAVYNNNNIHPRLRSLLLIERALCRNILQDYDGALRDAKIAISLDPKSASARKCRYKVYRNMATEAANNADDGSETDELDENGASSDDERGTRPGLKRLLMKGAFDALAAFVLGGSSNLALAGEAEDAAREACRDSAKAYFWKRHNEGAEEEDECTDDDDENEEVEQVEKDPLFNEGDISSLCRCGQSEIGCGKPNCGIYSALIKSSSLPKRWMVSAFQALYAPIHTALDIPLPAPVDQIAAYDDGLGEDPAPFEHIVSNQKTQIEEELDNPYPDQPEGDDDAFRLICKVANALSRGVDGTNPDFSIDDLQREFESQSLTDGSSDFGQVRTETHLISVEGSPLSLEIAENSKDLVEDLLFGQFLDNPINLMVESSGIFSESPHSTKSISKVDAKNTTWDCSSPDFLEAFELITAPLAHELTGVNFRWKDIGNDFQSSTKPHKFRVNVGLTPAMQDAICDRSMHNSMHNVDSYESDDSDKSSQEEDDDDNEDENSGVLEEKKIRKVSRQLRARLLSLCGSIAYLLGDSMGGYQCMKASILLEGENLDSRIKIATMLMEMDELDKAEVHLNDARRKWPNEVVVDLHEAELAVHRTDYTGAVEILRKASRKFQSNRFQSPWMTSEGNDLTPAQKTVQDHLGPSVFSLHGVAEFRVNPENPERAISVLQQGVDSYPRSTSLLVCLGEVLAQAGDPSGALSAYAKAARLEPGHPMPYLNASRVYQQLNQLQLAKLHMRKALRLDDALSLTLVDIAQYKIQERKRLGLLPMNPSNSTSLPSPTKGSTPSIDLLIDEMSVTEILDYALSQARHVSEILDIFTARQIASFYHDLQETGLVSCIV